MPAIRPPKDIELAVKIYYEKISLKNADIKSLFGVTSNKTVARYKSEVIEYFAEGDINPVHRDNTLDTWRAFEAWGIDINELEKRLKKLQKLKEILQ